MFKYLILIISLTTYLIGCGANATIQPNGYDIPTTKGKYDYSQKYVTVYDVKAFDSGEVTNPIGVTFKVKNNGNRSLRNVLIKVFFNDKNGKPVKDVEYDLNNWVGNQIDEGNEYILKPNYEFTFPQGSYFRASGIPTSWQEGNVTAKIVGFNFDDR